jgi:glycosyltransferase involved in cell wall biosynthesis
MGRTHVLSTDVSPSRPADDSHAAPIPTVALLVWGILYDEDFLDLIGVSLEAFAADMTGGYLFNYVEALRFAGIRTVVVLVARRVNRPTRLLHRATGATILALPASPLHRPFRWLSRNRRAKRVLDRLPWVRETLEEVSSYLSTPARTFMRELRREGCGALICQEYEYARFDACVLLGRRMGIPVFATFQGGKRLWGTLQRFARPIALRHCAGLIIGPRQEIQRVQAHYGVPDAKIAQIFNPIDPDALQVTPRAEARAALNLPDEARVVVWHGRVARYQKGLDVLLDAWERICRDRPHMDLRLLMVGTGHDSDWLRQRIAETNPRGIHWRDEFIHDRRVLRLHLSAADAYAFPSRHEGFPVSPIEAMACGVPLVAAAADGVPDILEDGEASGGLIVPIDDADSLACALGRVLDDRDWALRLGQAGQRRVRERFSPDVVGRQLARFLLDHGLVAPQADMRRP